MKTRFPAAAILTVTVAIATAAPPSTLHRARQLYRNTDYRAALALLEPGKSRDPETLLLAGQAAYGLGQPKQASDYLEKAAALDPRNPAIHHWLGRSYGRRAETASFLTAPGLASKCRREFEQAVDLGHSPGNLEAMADLMEYYLEAPGFLGGGRDKAAAMANRIAQADPAEGEFAWARIAEKDKNLPEAEKHWRRAVELEPDKPERIADLARFLARNGRFDESDAQFDKALRIAPDKPALWFARAETWIESSRNPEPARRLLELYIASHALTPDDPPRDQARRLIGKIK
ncbi:MAG: tetratricopeptide repeat protein [Bryobacteraceae bacterium]